MLNLSNCPYKIRWVERPSTKPVKKGTKIKESMHGSAIIWRISSSLSSRMPCQLISPPKKSNKSYKNPLFNIIRFTRKLVKEQSSKNSPNSLKSSNKGFKVTSFSSKIWKLTPLRRKFKETPGPKEIMSEPITRINNLSHRASISPQPTRSILLKGNSVLSL